MVHYRHLQSNDSNLISRLYHKMIMDEFKDFPEAAKAKFSGDWTANLMERINNPFWTMLGAFDENGEALAFLYGLPPDGGVGTINWLAVHPDHRNKKIGKTLIQHACDEFKKMGCHKIRVHTETEAANNFYIHVGFQQEGFHPTHWWKMDYHSLGLLI